MDPLAEKFYSVSPYAYCNGNPVIFVDPDGQFPETLWDIANVVMDVQSLVSNIREGNKLAAAVDGVGLVLDAAAAVVPFVPGGVGTAIKAVRGADKVVDATKACDKVADVVDLKGAEKPLSKVKEALIEAKSKI